MFDYGQTYQIRSTLIRGGTSKGLIIRTTDLPTEPKIRDRVLLRIFGSPDHNQIDGLGGGTSLTSKLALVGPPSQPKAHIDYTFGQVSLNQEMIDYKVSCGNMASAVGLYAAEEGFVTLTEPVTEVHIYNTNTGKRIVAEIPVRNGQIEYEGNFSIDGVPGSASKIMLNFLDAGGTFTGKTLPTNHPIDRITLDNGRQFQVSIVDSVNTLVFVQGSEWNIPGAQLHHQLETNEEMLQDLEEIRLKAGMLAGIIHDKASVSAGANALPKIAVIHGAEEFTTTTHRIIRQEEIDIISAYISMGRLHRAFAVSGAVALATAAHIPDTLPNRIFSTSKDGIRIGHPSGVIYAEAAVQHHDSDWSVKRAAIGRTARRLMDGFAFVPTATLSSSNV
ncbi:2-methylaconitate cis-trans isomerase PrpF family protein [Desmospora activa]|uniref:2-methylaconitate cis-trans isomerase n=1 Tax=Desmospora activa DSM 45169 TaxID=1121389 RepID=A0A2T4ZAZ5_9BACL|nr:PrpF domain-containing protein [Desmospora activa]PTM59046.1 hypothetical protein C8J48_1646 [Desmospora activa DSM 45169]